MPHARRLLRLSLLLAALAAPGASRADEVIPDKILVRKFPQGQFCALPISITFTAPAEQVMVKFAALEFVDDGSGTLTWTEQAIDNVSIATTAQVVANFAPPPAGSNSEFCYNGDPQPVSYFHFNRAGLTLVLLERFDTDPSARGWDLSAGGYFKTGIGNTAPRDVENEADFTGGSLGIGPGTGTPAAGVTRSGSIRVTGLTQGVSYDLGAWWNAGFVRFPPDVTYLTISISTVSGTPVARKSWGGLKSSYR